MPISREEIEAARTPRGGWTKAQLAEWGVSWPPPRGWRAKLEGRRVSVHDDARVITVKFPARCVDCNRLIDFGEEALWNIGEGLHCLGECPPFGE